MHEIALEQSDAITAIEQCVLTVFDLPFMGPVLVALAGSKDNLKDIRYRISECPGGRPRASFSSRIENGCPLVIIKADLFQALMHTPNDAHLKAFFFVKLLHEFLHLCHRSQGDPSHSTPDKFQCARAPSPTSYGSNMVEAGRWLEEQLFGGWLESMQTFHVPNSTSNKLAILTESWAFPLSDKAVNKVLNLSVWRDIPVVQVKSNIPNRPSGPLLNEHDDFDPVSPSRFSAPDADVQPSRPWDDGLSYHCCHL